MSHAVFVMVTAIAAKGAVQAQSSSSGPDVARSTTLEPQSTTTSVWEAPEPWRTDRFYFETSLYTRHFRDDAAHNDHQDAIVVEWNVTQRWLIGASAFNNSYGQASQYVYGGYRFRHSRACSLCISSYRAALSTAIMACINTRFP